jgi:hypothetical protein
MYISLKTSKIFDFRGAKNSKFFEFLGEIENRLLSPININKNGIFTHYLYGGI